MKNPNNPDELAALFMNLSEKDRAHVLDMMRGLLAMQKEVEELNAPPVSQAACQSVAVRIP